MRTASKTMFYLYLLTLVVSVYFYYTTINSEQYKRERWLYYGVIFYYDATNYNMAHNNGIYEMQSLELIAFSTWDYAYFFKPGTTKKEIEEIIGFTDKNIPKIIKEGYTQALFVTARNTISCNIHSKKDYQFYFGDFQDDYVKICYGNRTMCGITRSDNSAKMILDFSPETQSKIVEVVSENGWKSYLMFP
jgi:hypothetical protein